MACFIMLALTYMVLYFKGRIFVNQKVPGDILTDGETAPTDILK